jgi:hypothetical protein
MVRDALKLGRDRERLAALEPGGSPDRPILVQSAAVIEIRARAQRCLRCDGGLALDEHAAITVGTHSLRVTHLRCTQCGTARQIYFEIVVPS